MVKNYMEEVREWLASHYLTFGLILLVTVVFVFTFLEPIKDGDFFWQVEYGRYLWENKTLIPDHSIYSWTPADNNIIYCAWIAELILFFVHSIGGIPLAFVFKFICAAIPFGVVLWYAYKTRQLNDRFLILVVLLQVMASGAASDIKPEIMSFVFFGLTSGLYFAVKSGLLSYRFWSFSKPA